MKKGLVTRFLLIAFCFICCINFSSSAQRKAYNGMLWKIQKKSTLQEFDHQSDKGYFYIYGTLHEVQKDFLLPSEVVRAIKDSDQFYFEVSKKALDDKQQQFDLIYTPRHLRKFLRKKEYLVLAEDLQVNNGLNLETLGYIKPILLTSYLTPKIQKKELISMERLIAQSIYFEKGNDIEISGLETLKEHYAFLDIVPIKNQIQTFLKYYHNPELIQKERLEIESVYFDNDLSKIEEIARNINEIYPGLDQIMIDKRNDNWVKTMKLNSSSNKNQFYAIGSGHLNDILEHFSSNGYTITSVITTDIASN